MSVSAVVVNYNARDQLVACVRSLRAAGVADVVVADNASDDGSEEALAAADPAARFVRTGANLGYGGGANRGAAAADPTSTALLVLNPDTVVAPGTVDALCAALEADAGLAVVGPRIENPDGSVYPSARAFPRLVDALGHAFLGPVLPRNRFTRRYRMLDWGHSSARPVDWVSGACFLVRRSAWDEVGGFDESYFMFMEDVDLCWRLWRRGWRVAYEPAGRVVHVVGASRARHPYRMQWAHHRSMFRFATRTTTGWARALLPLMAVAMGARLVAECAREALARRRGERRPVR